MRRQCWNACVYLGATAVGLLAGRSVEATASPMSSDNADDDMMRNDCARVELRRLVIVGEVVRLTALCSGRAVHQISSRHGCCALYGYGASCWIGPNRRHSVVYHSHPRIHKCPHDGGATQRQRPASSNNARWLSRRRATANRSSALGRGALIVVRFQPGHGASGVSRPRTRSTWLPTSATFTDHHLSPFLPGLACASST